MCEIEIYEKICRGIPITRAEFEKIKFKDKWMGIPIVVKNKE